MGILKLYLRGVPMSDSVVDVVNEVLVGLGHIPPDMNSIGPEILIVHTRGETLPPAVRRRNAKQRLTAGDFELAEGGPYEHRLETEHPE